MYARRFLIPLTIVKRMLKVQQFAAGSLKKETREKIEARNADSDRKRKARARAGNCSESRACIN